MPSTRRRLLRSLAPAGLLGMAGCTTGDGVSSTPNSLSTRPVTATATARQTAGTSPQRTETGTETSSPTESPSNSPTQTPVAIDEADLSFSVSVGRQPDEKAPGRIRASLTNATDARIALGGGDPIPVGFDHFPAKQVDADATLVLFPDEGDRVNDYFWYESGEKATIDDAVYDDCWSLPGTEIAQTEVGETVALDAEATVNTDLYPLGFPDAACPRGTYRASGEMRIDSRVGWNQYVLTTLTVEVAADGSLAVDGSMDVQEP